MMITMMMINTRTSPTWKLYENPFYTSPQNHHQENKQQQEDQNKQLHLLHLPVSTRKITASFWDLTFIKPFMDSELDTAKAQIMELKAQLEYERKARKKAESLNKKLTKEVCGERKEREAVVKVCEELAGELAASKSEMSRLKMEMEEERKMLRVAEVLREERVQMKLSEAKFILEEKISELEIKKMTQNNNDQEQDKPENRNVMISQSSLKLQGRKASLEPENPHIKRGIRGFVEFPRVVRAIGSRSRNLGTKLECQKAQLMILLKQKTQIQSNNLIMS
ncbi:protein BRANCHLESS TRICHOME-like [Bidens hawaiensis]|uniref:protein BRANCHLESS TRICHOME-like n=1 Tax=Bidens hawaiensis TaxID=980011 RepID=UPI00404B1234